MFFLQSVAECVIYTNNKKKLFVANQWLLIPRNDLDYIKDIANPQQSAKVPHTCMCAK